MSCMKDEDMSIVYKYMRFIVGEAWENEELMVDEEKPLLW